jgi:ubiquinone/menaquinone biosynthesis C-methylase UbiE
MTPDLQRRVQRYGWDQAADHYEHHWQRQLKPAQDLLLEMAEIRPGDRVLDVACGTGLVTLPAAEAALPDGFVLGTDLSSGMLESARRVAAEAQIDNVSFAQMDAESLDLPDESFDAALCALGLMYVPDPLAAVREMHRVLERGGSAVAAVWGARQHCGWAEVFPIVDARVKSDVCPLFFRLGTGDALEAAFREAGFTGVKSKRIAAPIHHASPEDACGAVFAGGPVALAYNRFDEDTRQAVHGEYLASIEEYRDGAGYSVPGEFVVVSGAKGAA